MTITPETPNIHGLCGLPDSIQQYVVSRIRSAGVDYKTICSETCGFPWQATQTKVGTNDWVVELRSDLL